MKLFNFIITITMLHLILTNLLLSDSKYVMNSGAVYYGEKIAETDSSYNIKTWESDFSIELKKSDIKSINPVFVVLQTKRNFEINGTLESQAADTLIIITSEGATLKVAKVDVVKLEYLNNTRGYSRTPIDKIEIEDEVDQDQEHEQRPNTEAQKHIIEIRNATDKSVMSTACFAETYDEYFPLAGIKIGTPGFLNASFGYHFNALTLNLHGGAQSDKIGMQTSLLFNVYETRDYDFGLSAGICFGYKYDKSEIGNREDLNFKNEEFSYSGMLLQIQWYGLTLEIGRAKAIHSNKNEGIDENIDLINFGYIYYFND